MQEKVIITTFTDPMMGLSYECEPIFRKLETHFSGKIEFRFVMSGLVRDVYQLVNPEDMKHDKEKAIVIYNRKLAEIYRNEENISRMPVNMSDFHLFDAEHRSSMPLNLAYKAAQMLDQEMADIFLYQLRYATIVECRQTNRLEEILNIAEETGFSKTEFELCYRSSAAGQALDDDLSFAERMNIHTLPTYMISYKTQVILIPELIRYDVFVQYISRVTGGEMIPSAARCSSDELRKVIRQHPLISPIEIREAFDFTDMDEVQQYIKPLEAAGEIRTYEVSHGWFITSRLNNMEKRTR